MDAIDWLAQWGRRLLMLVCRTQFGADLEEEMRLHQELREREQIEPGLSPGDVHPHVCSARRSRRYRQLYPGAPRNQGRSLGGAAV